MNKPRIRIRNKVKRRRSLSLRMTQRGRIIGPRIQITRVKLKSDQEG
jgi:hypothetical protein